MRSGDAEAVVAVSPNVTIINAEEKFLNALAGVTEPEMKRRIIGETFVQTCNNIMLAKGMEEDWILGQGTIYPDTIESGGTELAETIKTHHNQVEGIKALVAAGRVVEPLRFLYKDEVRALGRELGISDHLLSRHPFPGPGLAIRCLCSPHTQEIIKSKSDDGWILPISTVGVQGDSRTYRYVAAYEKSGPDLAPATIINGSEHVNRVVSLEVARAPLAEMRVIASSLTNDRISLLRKADAFVRDFCTRHDLNRRFWQFPVILIPVGTYQHPDSIVLRPIDSQDGMTAQAVWFEKVKLLAHGLLSLDGVCGVFFDHTPKPPGTIEWE